MINYRTPISPDIESLKAESGRLTQCRTNKVESKQLWFYIGVAPMAVMLGWVLVGLSLTGNWAWELPLGLTFSLVGSMVVMVNNLLKF